LGVVWADSPVAEVYKTSLAPASLTGLASFTAGLLFAGYIGGIVDRMPKLQFLRRAVAGQKVCPSVRLPLNPSMASWS
jgi:hypothetical protein